MFDWSGRGNKGAITGATWARESSLGGASVLEFSGAENNRVQFPASAGIDSVGSIGLWFLANSVSQKSFNQPAGVPNAIINARAVTGSQIVEESGVRLKAPLKTKILLWNATGQNATSVTLEAWSHSEESV